MLMVLDLFCCCCILCCIWSALCALWSAICWRATASDLPRDRVRVGPSWALLLYDRAGSGYSGRGCQAGIATHRPVVPAGRAFRSCLIRFVCASLVLRLPHLLRLCWLSCAGSPVNTARSLAHYMEGSATATCVHLHNRVDRAAGEASASPRAAPRL